MTDEYADYEEYDYQACEDGYDQEYLCKKTSFTIIAEDEVLQVREKFIKQALERVDFDRDSIILALTYFKWNVYWLAEKWYDNPEKYSEEAGIIISKSVMSKLAKEKVFPNNKDCSVCFVNINDLENSSDMISLSCKHFFCIDCWKEYLSEKLKEINTVIYSSCPQSGCNCIVTESIFKQVLKNKDNDKDYKKYFKAVIKNFTEFNCVIKSCPSPGCETYILCEHSGNKEVHCVNCKCTYCFSCLRDGHKPCTCDMITYWESKNKSESENVKWLQINTKKCPNCHKHIEKNQGCNHMTCRKEAGGCGYEFCWLCMGKWSGHSACNKYEDDTKKKTELKHELDRYIHYFDRYMNYKKSYDFALKLKPHIQEQIEKFNDIKEIPYLDLIFLQDGVKTVIDSKRILMNSYIFGFLMKKTSTLKSFI